ncbi:MAG: hypothetical protein QOI83_1060 [Streptomycetaceae bacterium]|nr:hypothetical protein [Streptomycetaceae bacterium]
MTAPRWMVLKRMFMPLGACLKRVRRDEFWCSAHPGVVSYSCFGLVTVRGSHSSRTGGNHYRTAPRRGQFQHA